MNKIKRYHSGFAMVEVLVTAVIVAIGISGMGVLLLKSLKGTQDNAQRSQAMWIVQDFAGRIRANSVGARAGGYNVTSSPDCSKEPAKMCADHRDEDDKLINVTDCTAAEMAVYDVWITTCGVNPEMYTSASDFMANPKLESICGEDDTVPRVSTYSGEDDCIRYTINFTWDTRIEQAADAEADRIYTNTYTEVVEVN